jgi:serine/threonine protein kinase
MDYENRLKISYYETIATIDEEHGIYVVQHKSSKKIYIKKVMTVYNRSVYESLMSSPVHGITQIYALYEEDNKLICIEEYISGDTLQSIIDKGLPVSEETIIYYLDKLCCILEQLHSHQPPIIHRDIKPSNIMITSNNGLFLLDLNAAKYYSEGHNEDTVLLGTQGYAAPEQYGFGASSVQTDIYSIGVLIKTLCTGSPNGIVAPNSKLAQIADKCTKLKPEERYQNSLELKSALNPKPSSTPQVNGIRSFLPPGFRSLQPSHMVVASITYALIIYLCVTLEVKDTNAKQLSVEKLGVFLMFMSFILCTFNYLGIQSHAPFSDSENSMLRVIGKILFSIIIPTTIFIITILVTSIF